MIKLKIEAENGADLRMQLLNLLGDTGIQVSAPSLEVKFDRVNPIKAESPQEPEPINTPEVKKRASRKASTTPPVEEKQELFAEDPLEPENEDLIAEDPETEETKVEEAKQDEESDLIGEEEKVYTKAEMAEIVIALGKQGKKAQMQEMFMAEFGVEKLSEMKAEDYPRLFVELEKMK